MPNRKERLAAENILEKLYEAGYSFVSFCNRDADYKETIDIINIIRSDAYGIKDKLLKTHKYSAGTIQSYMCTKEMTCSNFDETKCDCFLPDINYKDRYCRRNYSEAKAGRGSSEYKEWRSAVFYRDNYTCKKCFVKGATLNAHHIKSYKEYKELRYDINNGITYCEPCHREEHKK